MKKTINLKCIELLQETEKKKIYELCIILPLPESLGLSYPKILYTNCLYTTRVHKETPNTELKLIMFV